jgi:molybdopterin converting factor small subunit
MGAVRVLFFASLRGVAGCEQTEVNWEGGAALDAEAFWDLLDSRFPGIAARRQGVRLARNLEYLADGEPICSGDEVAVIPPVSGG